MVKDIGTQHAVKQYGPEEWYWADVESELKRERKEREVKRAAQHGWPAFVITWNLVNEI